MSICLRARIRRSILVCLALVMVFLLTVLNVQANTVTINDQSGI
ncbi:MAG: hypothetical protein ACJ8CB_18815 [Ktedonobacteraceae bacterium]